MFSRDNIREDNVDYGEESSVTGKRGRKSRSIVWDIFEKLPVNSEGRQKARCTKCDQLYMADLKSGTSNLKRHLKTCCPEHDTNELEPQLPFDQDAYRKKLSDVIIKHNYPFKFVEHEGIRELHNFLNSDVKSISRNTAKLDILKAYKREKEQLKHALELIPSRICLTSDLWTSLTTDGYMTLTAHYVDEHWVLQKRIKKVCQDVPTRWNSTYLMLECALLYRRAFCQLQLIDTNFKTCPSQEEWNMVERIAKFLKPFYDITTLFSGSQYPTSNLYFRSVWNIQTLILEELNSPNKVISSMAQQMKGKFDKYWECYSIVLSFAIVLDPRYKLKFVEFAFAKLDPETCEEKIRNIRMKLHSLFQEYKCFSPSAFATNPSTMRNASSGVDEDEMDEFELFERERSGLNRNKSQLDLYLEESLLDRRQNALLDVLSFWKTNRTRYPELSLMARDVLSIPITTVASESAFSIGGRIIGKYRSSILPKNVEALLCTRDWLHGLEVQEDSDEEEEELAIDIEKLISGFGGSSNDVE